MILDSGEQRGISWRFSHSRAAARLRWAFLLSVGVHLLILANRSVPPPLSVAMPGPLRATLQPPPARALSTASAALPPTMTPPMTPPRPTKRAAAAQRADGPVDKPAMARHSALHAVSPAPTFSLPAEPPRQASAPASPAVATLTATTNANGMAGGKPEAQHETSPGAQQETPRQETGISADGLRRYRLSLAAQARRFKRYPPQALAAGWSGTVNIRLAVDASTQSEASVARSSGHAVLDEAARTMIAQSAQRTPLPEELRGKAFSLELPVLFNIADEFAGSARAEPAE